MIEYKEGKPYCVTKGVPDVVVVIEQSPIEYITDKTTRELSLLSRGLENQVLVENPNDTLGIYAPHISVLARIDYDYQDDGIFSIGADYQCLFYKNVVITISMKPAICTACRDREGTIFASVSVSCNCPPSSTRMAGGAARWKMRRLSSSA